MGKSGGVSEKAPAGSKKTRKRMATKTKWIILFSGFGVLIVGLVIAIVVVAATRTTSVEDDSCKPVGEMTEQEIIDRALAVAESDYSVIYEAINEVIQSMQEPTEEDIVSLYEHYIGETESEYAKAMLQSDLLLILMGYDTENVEGDRLIEEAQIVDEVLKTPNSAALIMNLAQAYGRTELYDRYEEIMIQREIDKGYDIETETEG